MNVGGALRENIAGLFQFFTWTILAKLLSLVPS